MNTATLPQADFRMQQRPMQFPQQPGLPQPGMPQPRLPQSGPIGYDEQPRPLAPEDLQYGLPGLEGFKTQRFDVRRYWVGSALTAVVAAMIGLIGMIIGKDILTRAVPIHDLAGLGAVGIGAYTASVAVIAVVAAVLYAVIARLAPQPGHYFGWIGSLGVVLAVVLPFTLPLALLSQTVFAIINLAVGAAIVALVPVAASVSGRRSDR